MNVLLVHSGNAVSQSSEYTFVREQGEALRELGINVFYYAIKGRHLKGYLSKFKELKETINDYHIDLVHAHYGLCGALAVLQRSVPVVITFHNGETLSFKGKLISSSAAWLSKYNIFVAQHIHDKLFKVPKEYSIIPCGIDLKFLPIVNKEEAMGSMGLRTDVPNILFGGSFSNARKNYPLAKEALALLPYKVNLIEMKGFSRSEVDQLLCGCDLFLMPTKSEGSPQVVKEALACNCPIVATKVADIPELLSGVSNCYTTGFDASEIAERVDSIIKSGQRSNGREKVILMDLDNPLVAKRIKKIYEKVLSK